MVYVSRTLAHSFVFPKESGREDCILLTGHHVLTLVACSLTIAYPSAHFFSSVTGCVTVTSIFLSLVLAVKDVQVQGKPFRSQCRYTFAALSGLLWLSYVTFRLLLLPYVLFTAFQDMFLDPEQSCNKMNTGILILNTVSVIAVLLESLLWFKKINVGFLKALKALCVKEQGICAEDLVKADNSSPRGSHPQRTTASMAGVLAAHTDGPVARKKRTLTNMAVVVGM